MAKIPIKQTWQSYDDDAARDWEEASYSNVRQPTSARVLESLAHGVNHLAAKNPRPMFSGSVPADVAETDGKDPLMEWAYEDTVDNGMLYDITIVAVPRTATNAGNASVKHWDGASLYDSEANGIDINALAVASVNKYYDASYETLTINRDAVTNARVVDGVSTFNGYTVLHVGAQERPLYALETTNHIYCTPTLAKKGKAILADAAEDLRSTFHQLRSRNLPIVMSYSALGDTTIEHTNSVPANLFDTSVDARSATSPGMVYDAQYCARQETNVKVYCTVKATLTAGDDTPCNVTFHGPLGSTTISIAPSDSGWHGNTDHYLYLDPAAAPTWTNVGLNKIDVMAAVNHTATDTLDWSQVRCWSDYE